MVPKIPTNKLPLSKYMQLNNQLFYESSSVIEDFLTASYCGNSLALSLANFIKDHLAKQSEAQDPASKTHSARNSVNLQRSISPHPLTCPLQHRAQQLQVLVELGAGQGKLLHDVLVILQQEQLLAANFCIIILEQSHKLRKQQHQLLARFCVPVWITDISQLAALIKDKVSYLIANEFFDALGYDQYLITQAAVYKRFVELYSKYSRLYWQQIYIKTVDKHHFQINKLEHSQQVTDIMRGIAQLVEKRGLTAIIIDYGYITTTPKLPEFSLQAVKNHRKRVFESLAIGEGDLSCLVNFRALENIVLKQRCTAELTSQTEFILKYINTTVVTKELEDLVFNFDNFFVLICSSS